MKTIQLDTAFIGLNQLTTYWGILDSCYILNDDLIESDFEEKYIDFNRNYYDYHFDNNKYMTDLTQKLSYILEPEFLEIFNCIGVKKVNFNGYHSPKEYNFMGDTFFFEITVSKNFETNIIKFIKKLDQDSLSTFLEGNYSSYDGFMSFTANNISELIQDLKDNNKTAIGAIMAYLFSQNSKLDLDYIGGEIDMYYTEYVDFINLDNCINDLKSNCFISGSYSGIDAEMEQRLICGNIESFIMAEYDKEPSLLNVELQEKYSIDFDFTETINKVYKEIDNKTLNIFQ